MIDDPYSVLEVSLDATEVEIKAAYRRLAATYHPDRNPGFQDAANEKLKELNAAHEAIKAARLKRRPGAADPPKAGPEAENGSGGDGTQDEPAGQGGNDSHHGPEGHRQGHQWQPDHRGKISEELAAIGLPGEADPEEPTVDVLTSLIPRGAGIELCVGYASVSTSAHYGFREMHRSVMRIAGAPGFSSMPLVSPTSSPVVRGEAILCTEESLFWTSRSIAPIEPPWAEVMVTACALDFADVLGSKVASRRKGEVAIWIDDGPTLTFRTGRADAGMLSEYVDAAAASHR